MSTGARHLRHEVRTAATLIGIVYVSGLILGAIGLGMSWLSGGELPKWEWEWWQYVLAPLGIGLIGLVLEGIAQLVGKPFGISHPGTPKWKEYLGVLTVLGVVIGIVVLLNGALR